MAYARSGAVGRLQLGSTFGRLIAVVMLAVVTPAPSLASEPPGVPATDSCCNVVELRQYTLQPEQREAFIALFDGAFADPLDATGMTVIGQFRDLDRPDRFVWMRGFQNMEIRPKQLAAFYDSDLWRSHRNEANASLVDSDNVLLLEPASLSLRLNGVPPRSSEGHAETDGGLIVATLYYTKPDTISDFASLFDRSLRGKTETAGAQTVAAYVTSTHDNNYPRLPIRVGEPIYVWIAGFASPQAYAEYRVKLEADRDWARTLWPSARSRLLRDPEVLRLTPTSRSRLRITEWTSANTREPSRAVVQDPSGLKDFDFLIGRWRVHHRRLKERLAGSHEWIEFEGTSVAQKFLGGLGNMDENVLDLPGDPYSAATLRVFDSKTRQWSIWWLDSRTPGGSLEPAVRGGFKNGVGEFYANDSFNGRPIRVRFIWSRITPTSCHWEQAFSSDQGATWETNWEMDFVRD